MATNRDWQLGQIELPDGADQALGVWATGDTEPNFKVLADGTTTVKSLVWLGLGAATTPTMGTIYLTHQAGCPDAL